MFQQLWARVCRPRRWPRSDHISDLLFLKMSAALTSLEARVVPTLIDEMLLPCPMSLTTTLAIACRALGLQTMSILQVLRRNSCCGTGSWEFQ